MPQQRALVLCTGNSCRSQMAEGFLRSFDPNLEVHSAGTEPAARVHPLAVQVMREVGIDLSAAKPRDVNELVDQPFDHVITVCGDADRHCPRFRGRVGKRVHIGFFDPARVQGTEDRVLASFREVREDIRARLYEYYEKEIKT
jgi:arsenate reductase (thioredoxin)